MITLTRCFFLSKHECINVSIPRVYGNKACGVSEKAFARETKTLERKIEKEKEKEKEQVEKGEG